MIRKSKSKQSTTELSTASQQDHSEQWTHLDPRGQASMVDVGEKQRSQRQAIAEGWVLMSESLVQAVEAQSLAKGDVLAVARIAGIQAAKKCADLIPLCHPLMLTSIKVDCLIDKQRNGVHIQAICKLNGQTGVEMEALTAVSVAALTIYDMCKALDKSMIISDIALVEKSGGKSGDWKRHA